MFITRGQNRGYLNPKTGVSAPRSRSARFAFAPNAVRRDPKLGCGGGGGVVGLGERMGGGYGVEKPSKRGLTTGYGGGVIY